MDLQTLIQELRAEANKYGHRLITTSNKVIPRLHHAVFKNDWSIHPSHGETNFCLGHWLVFVAPQKRWRYSLETASELFETALKQGYPCPAFLAYTCRFKNPKAYRQMLHEAMQLDDPWTHFFWAQELRYGSFFDDAMNHYQMGIDRGVPEGHYYIGKYEKRIGNYASSWEHLTKGVQAGVVKCLKGIVSHTYPLYWQWKHNQHHTMVCYPINFIIPIDNTSSPISQAMEQCIASNYTPPLCKLRKFIIAEVPEELNNFDKRLKDINIDLALKPSYSHQERVNKGDPSLEYDEAVKYLQQNRMGNTIKSWKHAFLHGYRKCDIFTSVSTTHIKLAAKWGNKQAIIQLYDQMEFISQVDADKFLQKAVSHGCKFAHYELWKINHDMNHVQRNEKYERIMMDIPYLRNITVNFTMFYTVNWNLQNGEEMINRFINFLPLSELCKFTGCTRVHNFVEKMFSAYNLQNDIWFLHACEGRLHETMEQIMLTMDLNEHKNQLAIQKGIEICFRKGYARIGQQLCRKLMSHNPDLVIDIFNRDIIDIPDRYTKYDILKLGTDQSHPGSFFKRATLQSHSCDKVNDLTKCIALGYPPLKPLKLLLEDGISRDYNLLIKIHCFQFVDQWDDDYRNRLGRYIIQKHVANFFQDMIFKHRQDLPAVQQYVALHLMDQIEMEFNECQRCSDYQLMTHQHCSHSICIACYEDIGECVMCLAEKFNRQVAV